MLAGLLLLGWGMAAHAQSSAPPAAPPTRPWAKGVSAADQAIALRTFLEGNKAFGARRYAEAAAAYRKALARWQHPSIHGNLAVALIHLEQPVAAFAQLELALRFGQAPFQPNIYQQLLTHQKLLSAQVAYVHIECRVAAAEVVLDGASLFACPKVLRRIVRAGEHSIVARKRGYLTFTQQFVATSGRITNVEVLLVPLSDAGGFERRWGRWKPWAVVGAGAAVVAVGGLFQLAASSNVSTYEREIAALCPNGCRRDELPSTVNALVGRARWQNRVAITGFIAGGLALASGVALVYANQPHRVHLNESGTRISAAPLLSEKSIGFALTGRY